MKHLKQIFQALLGVVALILTALVAMCRLAWRTMRSWWKNRSKWLRRSIATLVILIPLGIVAYAAYEIYDDAYGRDYWDYKLSEGVTVRSFNDNSWRVYNDVTGKYTTPRIDWTCCPEDKASYAVYAHDNRRGYLDIDSGTIVIDASANDYTKAWFFSEGLAAVMKGGKVGFINAQNEVVIPFKFGYNYADYIFKNGYCVMPNEEGLEGVIDKAGQWVVEPIYRAVSDADDNSGYRIIVDKQGRYGVLDSSMQLVYPNEYDYISFVDDGIVMVNNGVKQIIDFNGQVVSTFVVDRADILSYPSYCNEEGNDVYSHSRYATYMIYLDYIDYYGVIDRFTGEMIIPALYSDVRMISEDIFVVQRYNATERVLIDTKGDVISGDM